MQDYLTGRTEYVTSGLLRSRMTAVKNGVPQGSVIGPLLYAIYTNELTDVIKSPNCQGVAHRDSMTLFGQQCNVCGILTVYADDLTYTIANKLRVDNQNKITQNLEEN